MAQPRTTPDSGSTVARLASFFILAACALAVLTLVGWSLGLSTLTSLVPGYPSMNPLTAISALLVAGCLWNSRRAEPGRFRPWIARGAAALVAMIGLMRLISAIPGIDVPIDVVLFRDQLLNAHVHSRLGINTAVDFLCLGFGFLLLDTRSRRGWHPAETLFLTAVVISLMSILGYLYSAPQMRGIMALPTACALGFLSLGGLLVRRERGLCRLLLSDSPGGVLARRVIPPALLVPVALGWLRLAGQQRGLFGLEIGTALLVLIIVAVLVGLTWATGRRLDTEDRERRRIEEALRQSLQRQNLLVETSLIGVLTANGSGWITQANRAFLDLIGYRQDELPLRTEWITPPEWRDKTDEAKREIDDHGQATPFEKEYMRRDGTRVSVLIGAARIPDSGGEVLAFVVDLSGKRRAELEVDRMRRFLDSIVENLPNMVFVKDAHDLRFVRFNRAGEELLGFSRDQLIGKNDYDFFPTEEADGFVGKDREVLASGQLLDIPEEQIQTSRGELRTLHTKKVPILDGAGEPRYLLGISEDITDRKRAEQEVASLNEGLRRRTEELEVANRELEAFSYSVSHDLRAPLRHINGFADLLVRSAESTLDESGRRYLEHISSSAQSMGRLIDDLLSFSRMGRAQMHHGIVDLGTIVAGVRDALDRDLAGRSVTWTIEPLPPVQGDPEMLRLVFTNLLSNAVKYTGPRENAHIEVRASRNDAGDDVISIRDNGVGFDMNYAHKLFGVFQRLHGDDEFEGTGIGLANVRRIIRRHGGNTWAEGQVDAGATFYFTLPRSAGALENLPEAA